MFNKKFDHPNFTLENFEGPIDFLVHLVQKSEIDIYDIPLAKITRQYLELQKNDPSESQTIDSGAEFIGTAATLLWIKSRMLLPKHEQELLTSEEEDPHFDVIHQLLDYCRFKHIAKNLTELERTQSVFYRRGFPDTEEHPPKKPLGIEHLSLEDLVGIFQGLVHKSRSEKKLIHEEIWKVSDKIQLVRRLLKEWGKVKVDAIFSSDLSREELIVLFLAVLELMKMGDLKVIREIPSQHVFFIPTEG